MPRAQAPERYFLGYFTGEGLADGEQLRFGLSTGNSALDWTGLGGGKPSLVSQLGDQGLRDPFIIRSHDGDTFYMIATDLNWFNRNRDYQINDSQYIEVFESHDLVNWSPQRHVKVAPDNAGNAFAPEAYWDDSIGAYVVFWAQAMWNDPVNRTGAGNQQMWYTTTRDFRTFAPPAVWQNPAPQSRIDTTVIKVGDYYYRFTKNEAGNAASDVFSEKNLNLRDTNIANWTPVAPSIGRQTWVANQGYEGPLVFKANPGDTACPQQFYFWADRYTNGGGYQLSCSADIEAPKWTAKTPRFTNTGTVRHGTVTPLALREWNRIQGIANPDVATTTDLVLPGATIKEGDTLKRDRDAPPTATRPAGACASRRQGWEQTAYLDHGVASVTLPGTLRGGAESVKAEYLGYDFLTASQDGRAGHRPADPHAGRRHGRRQRPRDALAHPRRTGGLRRVHPGRRPGLHRVDHRDRHLDGRRRDAHHIDSPADQRGVQPRPAGGDHARQDGLERAGEQRRGDRRLQAVDRRDRAAAYRHLQRERHVHAVHDHALNLSPAPPCAPCARTAGCHSADERS